MRRTRTVHFYPVAAPDPAGVIQSYALSPVRFHLRKEQAICQHGIRATNHRIALCIAILSAPYIYQRNSIQVKLTRGVSGACIERDSCGESNLIPKRMTQQVCWPNTSEVRAKHQCKACHGTKDGQKFANPNQDMVGQIDKFNRQIEGEQEEKRLCRLST